MSLSIEAQIAEIMGEARTRQDEGFNQQPKPTVIHLPDGKTFTDPYIPTPKQILFHQAREEQVLYGGARGGAKTRAIVEHAKNLMLKWPGIPIAIGRKDFSDLKRTTMEEWLLNVHPLLYAPEYGGQHHKTDHFFRFYNGSNCQFTELKDVKSWRSATLGAWFIDEASEIGDEDDVSDLEGSLRWKSNRGECKRPECKKAAEESGIVYQRHHEHPLYQVRMATNPAPGYLRDKFAIPYREGRPLPGKRFIPSTIFDNPHLTPTYIRNLLRKPPAWVRNFVHGDWSSFENMAWPQFSRAVHTWHGALPPFARIEGGIDYGSTSEHAHLSVATLTGVTRLGIYITFWEYVEQSAPSAKMFRTLAEATQQFRVRKWYGDASQFLANGLLRDAGVPVEDAPRYQGAVRDGVNLVDRLMTPNAAGAPQWYITPECEEIMAGVESYELDKKTGDPVKKDDDRPDALRYNLMGMCDPSHLSAGGAVGSYRASNTEPSGRSTILERRRREKTARLAEVIRNLDRGA